MTPLRLGFVLVALAATLCAIPAPLLALQLQRAQVTVYVQVNVTPGPYGYEPHHRLAKGGGGNALAPRAVALVMPSSQAAVPVQANVQPNPSGTLLTVTPSFVSISAQAGAGPAFFPCAYTLSVSPSPTQFWSLESGLTADFSASFNGNSLAENLHVGAPPVPENYTPFTVYPDNNNAWSLAATGTGPLVLCVDLQLTIPVTVHSGTYGSTAVYTLYF